MTIQQKSLLIILVGVIGTIGIVYTISDVIVTASFQKLENSYVRNNSSRIYEIIDNELSHLSSIAKIYSANLDTNEKIFSELSVTNTIPVAQFNVLAIFDKDGSLLHGYVGETGTFKSQELPIGWQKRLSPQHPLYIPRDGRGKSKGIIKMPDGRALLASSIPIRNKFSHGVFSGTLILGKLFDLNKIQGLAKVSNVSISLLNLEQLSDEDADSGFYKSMALNAPYQIRIVDEKSINGFLLLKDIRNRAGYVLKITFPREIYHQGKSTLEYYTNLLLLIGIVIVIFVHLLMDQLVLSRLKRLGNGIRKVHNSADLKLHINMNGNDEFKYLADNFNELLDGLALTQAQLEKQIEERIEVEKEIRKSQGLYNQAELIGKLGHWEWDILNNCMLSCSEQFSRIFNMSVEESINCFSSLENELEYVHIDDRERVKKHILEAYEKNEMLDVEYRIISAIGAERYVHKISEQLREQPDSSIRAVGTLQDITRQKESQEKLELYQKKLRSLMSELALFEEKERRRIAEGLHDSTIQNLGLSKFKLAVFKNTLDENISIDILDEVTSIIDKAIDDTRTLVFELSPPILYDLGFIPAIEWLAEQFHQERDLTCEVLDDGKNKSLDNASKVMLFQIVRELLINIVKHSQARKATITITKVDDHINIVIKDDGIGFDISKQERSIAGQQGFGLFSIRERLNNIGEVLLIETSPENGTIISFSAPLNLMEVNAA